MDLCKGCLYRGARRNHRSSIKIFSFSHDNYWQTCLSCLTIFNEVTLWKWLKTKKSDIVHNLHRSFPLIPCIAQKCQSSATVYLHSEQWTITHQVFPIKPLCSCTLYFWAGLDMHSIFCSLGSWGWVNEAPLGLFHVKSSSDSADIVLYLKASPIVNKHPITQLGRHTDTGCIGWHTMTHTQIHTPNKIRTNNIS